MSAVNDQVVDTAQQAGDLVVGQGAAVSMTNTYLAASSSIAVVMANAALAEQASQQVAQAIVATTCAWIVKNGASA